MDATANETTLCEATTINEDVGYEKASSFWSSQPATVEGMLGGYGHISTIDVRGSIKFIKKAFNGLHMNLGTNKNTIAADCGAGIGRVAKNLLLPLFGKVDLVEQSGDFLDKARHYISNPRLDRLIRCGLQDFKPEENRYTLIWVQWVAIYLPDDDLVQFLRWSGRGLTRDGLICIKENVTKNMETRIEDDDDASVTRSHDILMELFQRADMEVVLTQQQKGFPADIFPVNMYAMRPIDNGGRNV